MVKQETASMPTSNDSGYPVWRHAAVVLALVYALTASPRSAVAEPSHEVVAWGSNALSTMPGLTESGATNIPVDLRNVIAVAAGRGHNLALGRDGTVTAWGWNDWGQTDVPGSARDVVAVAAGFTHSLALTSDGRVVAWGGYEGTVPVPDDLGATVAIATGGCHNLALLADGTVVAWGRYCDDGGFDPIPVDAPSGLHGIVAIAAGRNHSLALRADGGVVAWGFNDQKQSDVPIDLRDVTAIAAGSHHSLALTIEGKVIAWGSNIEADWSGLLTGQATVPHDLPRIVSIAAGRNHSLAVTEEGEVIAWGSNFSGTWENGRYTGQADVPPELSNVVAISGGSIHSIAILESSESVARPTLLGPRSVIAAVGWPFRHQVSAKNGAMTYSASDLPPSLALDPGTGLITGIPKEEGTYPVAVSGSNSNGTDAQDLQIHVVPPPSPWMRSGELVTMGLGQPTRFRFQAAHATRYEADKLPPGLTIDPQTGVISGASQIPGDHPVAIRAINAQGGVLSSNVVRVTPIITVGNPDSFDAPAAASNVVAIAAGGGHRLGVTGAGQVLAWGANSHGQTDTPDSLTRAVAVAAGGSHSLALTDAGLVVGWGYNEYGQATIPKTLSNVVAIAAGANHSLALKADGRVVGWGLNHLGQVAVPSAEVNLVAVAAGEAHSLALTAEGGVVAWGAGQVNTGEWPHLGQADVPSDLRDVVAIAAGSADSLALTSSGSVVAWGSRMANCCPAIWERAAAPKSLQNVVAIAAHGAQSVALTAEGAVVAWRSNGSEQSFVPDGPRRVVAIAPGASQILALLEYVQPPIRLRIIRHPDRLELSHSIGSPVRIQRSSNLLDWEDWLDLPLSEQLLTIPDPDTEEAPQRFYRALGVDP